MQRNRPSHIHKSIYGAVLCTLHKYLSGKQTHAADDDQNVVIMYDAGVPGDQLMMWIREAAGDIKRKDGDDISSAVHSDGTSTVPHPQMRQTASPTAPLFPTESFRPP